MPNSSGFVDFNQYRDTNQDDEQAMLERAMEAAHRADERAQGGLRAASRETFGKYDSHGQVVGEKALSETASYSDYLKAKQDAGAAWAAVNARSVDPRRAALQSTMGDARSGVDLGAQEAAAGAAADAHIVGLKGDRERAAADAEMKKNALAQREQQGEAAKARYLEALTKGAESRARAGGAQTDFVGGYNPYASSTWAQQQGAWEAQQIKNAGGGQAQQQGAWDAYTGKGSEGSTGSRTRTGTGPWNPYDSMQREMQPFAPDEEKD